MCLVGPPGVGKDFIWANLLQEQPIDSLLECLLVELETKLKLRGHRRTYIGSLPGKIIQLMKKAGSKNPLILLDEIDKVGNDYRGDPSSALLEALDPEQNAQLLMIII